MHEMLSLQQQNIRKQFLSDFCSAVLLLISAILLLIVAPHIGDGRQQLRLVRICVPLLGFFSLLSWVHVFQDWRILQAYLQAQDGGLHTRQFRCKKISFCLRRISKHRHVVVGITFRDENGEKFHFVYPVGEEGNAPAAMEFIKMKGQTVTVQCYQGSSALRDIRAAHLEVHLKER